jgi:hypothetical protein
LCKGKGLTPIYTDRSIDLVDTGDELMTLRLDFEQKSNDEIQAPLRQAQSRLFAALRMTALGDWALFGWGSALDTTMRASGFML